MKQQPENVNQGNSRFRKVVMYFLLFLVSLGVYVTAAPFVHPYMIAAMKYLPAAIFVGLTVLALLMVLRNKGVKRQVIIWSALACLFPALAVTTYFTNTNRMLVEWQLGQAVDPLPLQSIPETVNSRLVARATARMFLENATGDNRVQVGKPHLALINTSAGKKLVWRAGLEGTVYYYKWFDSVTGVVSIDAGQTQQSIVQKAVGGKAFFVMGHNSPAVDTILKIRHPFSERGNTVYWQKDNGDWVFLISYWSYRPTLLGTMVPYLAGVMEFSTMGTFWSHSASDAAEEFPGAALYPTELMEIYSSAYASYHKGLWNFYVAQTDLLEVAKEARDGNSIKNQFPFYQEFKSLGLQLVMPFEPQGMGRNALERILFFDAITGEARVYVVPDGKELNSPRIAIANANNAAPDADWNHYDIEEPVLSHGAAGTFWVMKVIIHDDHNPASVFIVAVKADQPDALTAIAFKTRKELDNFMKDHQSVKTVKENIKGRESN